MCNCGVVLIPNHFTRHRRGWVRCRRPPVQCRAEVPAMGHLWRRGHLCGGRPRARARLTERLWRRGRLCGGAYAGAPMRSRSFSAVVALSAPRVPRLLYGVGATSATTSRALSIRVRSPPIRHIGTMSRGLERKEKKENVKVIRPLYR